ncbi:MAG: protein-glutamine glutaminase family protein, partial [Bacteroidia bacterium]
NDELKNDLATAVPATQNQPLVKVMSVANIKASMDGASFKVVFNQNAEVFSVQEGLVLSALRQALTNKSFVKVTFNPWQASVIKVDLPSAQEITKAKSVQVNTSAGVAMKIDLETMNKDEIDNTERVAILNRTTPGLTNVIPDMATAQSMFDYISKQCCAIPGPYSIDYCISFQYAEDGCYARAQKMCAILNGRYHYDTHKIFSFANAGSDELSVKANKWGGCCVNWWYHVAPLVNIKTPTGVKAYVFDPAMFDQPVLLSAWLHAQQNPVCSGGYTPHVSMINIQPTVSYSPADYSGYSFDTDPLSANTDYTLVNYSSLTTCP